MMVVGQVGKGWKNPSKPVALEGGMILAIAWQANSSSGYSQESLILVSMLKAMV
jgi:hypothetical protein